MGFFSFLVLLGIAYLIWRVTDQLPDLIFRMSEIQRDVAEIRRRTEPEPTQTEDRVSPSAPDPTPEPSTSESTQESSSADNNDDPSPVN